MLHAGGPAALWVVAGAGVKDMARRPLLGIIDVENRQGDEKRFACQRVVVVHHRVGIRHLNNSGLLAGLAVFDDVTRLHSRGQLLGRHDGFLFRIIRPERLVFTELDFGFVAPPHAGHRLFERRKHLMLTLDELAEIPDLNAFIAGNCNLIQECYLRAVSDRGGVGCA